MTSSSKSLKIDCTENSYHIADAKKPHKGDTGSPLLCENDDNKFVDCAIAGNATYIVSNDSHFDVLKQTDFPKLVVKRIQEFSKILEQEVV